MSQNICNINITRGKNAGKLCFQVSERCRHIKKTCSKCSKNFTRGEAYARHTKACIQEELKTGFDELKKSFNDLNESVHKALIENISRPVTNITNTVIYQHIAISDIGAFKILCDKMGINEATNFLCGLAAKPRTMALFEKLFLECDPANYPIANNNGQDFYYRDEDDKIIHDAGGHKIAKLGERLMKNAFVEAADPLLTRFMKQNEGEHEGDNDDYDRFRELQNGAYSFKSDKAFIKDLYPKTYNPNHVFFNEIKQY